MLIIFLVVYSMGKLFLVKTSRAGICLKREL